MLLDNQGNVLIVTDFSDDTLPQQSNRQQVYDFVVSELNEVIPLLTEEIGPSTHGRFTRWAAKSLLTRIYINAEVYTGTPLWDAALNMANDIINNSPFALEHQFKSNFSITNENSQDIILVVPYTDLIGTGIE